MEMPEHNKAIAMVNATTTEREGVHWFDRFKESNPKMGFWPKWEIVWLVREVLAFERAAHKAQPDPWTDEVKDRCADKCGEFGDPPCWKLPGMTSDCPKDIKPCAACAHPVADVRGMVEALERARDLIVSEWGENCGTVEDIDAALASDRHAMSGEKI